MTRIGNIKPKISYLIVPGKWQNIWIKDTADVAVVQQKFRY